MAGRDRVGPGWGQGWRGKSIQRPGAMATDGVGGTGSTLTSFSELDPMCSKAMGLLGALLGPAGGTEAA